MPTSDSCLKPDAKFSRREWLMIIVILLLIEAGALVASHAFMSNQDVINYISFASTIASLLLAVLAIVYGFYQSESQRRTGDGVESHLSHLRVTTEQIRAVSTNLSENSRSVTDLSVSLLKLNDAVELTLNKISSVEGGLNSVARHQESFGAALNERLSGSIIAGQEQKNKSESVADVTVAELVLGSRAGSPIKLVAAGVRFAFEGREDDAIAIDLLGRSLTNVLKEDEGMSWSAERWRSAIIVCLSVLRSINVIEYNMRSKNIIESVSFNKDMGGVLDDLIERLQQRSERVELLEKMEETLSGLPTTA